MDSAIAYSTYKIDTTPRLHGNMQQPDTWLVGVWSDERRDPPEEPITFDKLYDDKRALTYFAPLSRYNNLPLTARPSWGETYAWMNAPIHGPLKVKQTRSMVENFFKRNNWTKGTYSKPIPSVYIGYAVGESLLYYDLMDSNFEWTRVDLQWQLKLLQNRAEAIAKGDDKKDIGKLSRLPKDMLDLIFSSKTQLLLV